MKKVTGILAGVIMTAMFPISALAADQQVTVTLPTFNVTLNGVKADSTQSQYPFLVYKDITYVPMTYHDARLLGLTTEWTDKKGLMIDKATVFDAQEATEKYKPYKGTAKNKNSYQATVASFPVTVGTAKITNSKEPYPLLVFRDITYFPLTWRFAVDEFGWKYTFDNKNGLNIMPISTAVTPPTIDIGGTTTQVKVTGNVVNIRAKASTNDAVVAQVAAGDILSVVNKQGDWYQVKLPNGKTGWIASWLVTENVAGSGGNSNITPSTKPSDSKTTVDLDSSKTLTINPSGKELLIAINNVAASDYKVTKTDAKTLTIKLQSGNFKPQNRVLNQDGVRAVAVSGQLITMTFDYPLNYAEKHDLNSKQLMITVKQSETSGNPGTTTPTVTTNNLAVKSNIPGTAQSVLVLDIGTENAAKVTASKSNKVVLTVNNNALGQFKEVQNTLGPITSVIAKDLGNNQVELTVNLTAGSYCVMEKSGAQLTITAKSRNATVSKGLSGKTIVLDPGHGGKDPGAIGSVLGVTDAEVGLAVCNTLKGLLEEQGAKVLMTRTNQSGFMEVMERPAFSNSVHADLFISVHGNSATNNTAFGTEIYYYAPDSTLTLAAQKAVRQELAQTVNDSIAAQTGRKCGVRSKNLGVLRGNDAPSILVETGYLSNAEEEALLGTPAYRDKIARGIFQGVSKYFSAY